MKKAIIRILFLLLVICMVVQQPLSAMTVTANSSVVDVDIYKAQCLLGIAYDPNTTAVEKCNEIYERYMDEKLYSPSKTYIDLVKDSWGLKAGLAIWQATTLVTKPSSIVNSKLDRKDYYEGLIKSIATQTLLDDENNLDKVVDAVGYCNTITDELCKLLNLENKDQLVNFKDLSSLNAKTTFQKALGDFGPCDILDTVLSGAETFLDAAERLAVYYSMLSLDVYVKQWLQEMYNCCDSNTDDALVSALYNLKTSSAGFAQASYVHILDTNFRYSTWAAGAVIDKTVSAWTSGNPIAAAVVAGLKLGQTISDVCFGASDTYEQLFLLDCIFEIQTLMREAVGGARSDFVNNQTTENAKAFLTFVELYFEAIINTDIDCAKKYLYTLCTKGILKNPPDDWQSWINQLEDYKKLRKSNYDSMMQCSEIAWQYYYPTVAPDHTVPSTSCNCSENYAGTYVCTTSSAPLTIRGGHGIAYSEVGSIPSGAAIYVTKASGTGAGNWAHVTYNGVSGYASMEYLGKQGTGNTTGNIVINGIDIGYANGSYFTKNGGTCKDYNNYHSNGTSKATCHNRTGYDCTRTTDPSCNCMRYWPTGSASTCQVDLKASQCFGYARYCQWRVYGTYDLNSPSSFTDITGDIDSSNCTGSYLKQKLINCAPATHLRTFSSVKGWGHSICIINATDYGVNFTDCNSDGCCVVRYKTMSWGELATFVKGYGGIDYANSYKNAVPSHTTHTYTGSYYEAAHPHKVYQMCSCDATKYTGEEKYVSTCGTCNPVGTSSTYNAVLPFTAYLKTASTVYPYTSEHLAEKSGGEIWSTDECTIKKIYSNGACLVRYPVGSSYKEAYVSLSEFIGDTSSNLAKMTVDKQIDTYVRASTSSTKYGYTDTGDVIYLVGTNGNMTQIFYPGESGYKLAWVLTEELVPKEYDDRFNLYCSIKCYPCATSDFDVYANNYTTVTGEIWTSDDCVIKEVYADGWCLVDYPADGTRKTAYARLSNFVYNVSASHTKYTAKAQTTTYTNQSLSTDNGWLSAGDVFYVVGAYGSASQVLYPIDAQYGGGYKLGWIKTSDLPKATYTISYNANGGTGALAPQTKTHGVAVTLSTTIPQNDGYAFVGWATSSSATSAAYAPGASYTSDANITLYAVWTLNKYEIDYDANGGTNAPAAQNKPHGTNLILSETVPTKGFTVTFNANGGTVDASTRQLSCEFLGWATSNIATFATYQPGGTFTTDTNATLYAVWKNPTLALYSIPARTGYVFDGWYTTAEGGTQITTTTTISSDMTVYAHWVVETYGVHYDANGGYNAPAEQIKTHGKDLKLSTTVPTRENYTFLGWASEENPGEVQYQPGDTYSVDMGVMLVAVWKCDLNPAFTVGSISGKPGDTVTVPIRISENPGIIAARLKVSYDSNALTLTNVTDGGILGKYKFGDDLSSNPYIVTWSNGTAQTDYTANGDLVYLTFKIADNAQAGNIPITISYDEEDVFNQRLENVTFATSAGNVTVEENDEIDPNALQIVLESKKTTVNKLFTVTVELRNNPGLSYLEVTPIIPAGFTLVKVENGELISDFTKGKQYVWVADEDVTDDGVLLTFTFTVSDEVLPGNYHVSFNVRTCGNHNEERVKFNVIAANIEVIDFIYGDATGDGVIDGFDVIRLKKYLANYDYDTDTSTVEIFAGADANGDGSVDGFDVIRLKKYLANYDYETGESTVVLGPQ